MRKTGSQMHRNSSNFGTTRSRGTAGYVGPSLLSVNEAALEDMNDDQPLIAKTLFQEARQTLTQPGMIMQSCIMVKGYAGVMVDLSVTLT